MNAPAKWTISTVREALTTKQLSARELTKDFYERIGHENPKLNAFRLSHRNAPTPKLTESTPLLPKATRYRRWLASQSR